MNTENRLQIFISILCLLVMGLPSNGLAQIIYEAQLSGSNEVPAHTSPATGNITATLTGSELVVEGSFEGLTGDYSASHIHLGMAGEAGGVIFPLSADVDGDNRGGSYTETNNSFDLTSGQIDTLNARGMYVNVHSSTYPGGEIRGQLVPEADNYFRTNLFGAFEVPAVQSTGSGGLVFELVGDSLFISGSFSGLSDAYSASHIHLAPAGSSGGVEIGLNPSINDDDISGYYFASDNRFELTAAQQSALWNRELYVNVHSSEYPGGELRGQITPPVTASFFASLSGSAENPSVNEGGGGGLVIELVGDSLFASGSFNALGSNFTASHIHTGHAGANGGVTFGLTADTDNNIDGTYAYSDNGFELTADQKEDLLARGMYVNVHAEDNPGGELRGQVLGDAKAYFRTNLAGIHEVQPVITGGTGAISLEVYGDNIIVSGGFDNLSSAYSASHLHAGPVGNNGGVEIGLSPTITNDITGIYNISQNTYTLSETQLTTLFDEGLYVNVHTSNNPGGELRGQVLFETNTFPDESALLTPDAGAEIMLSTVTETTFEATWENSADAENNELANIWQLSTDADFDVIVVNSNVGSSTSFQTTHGDLNNLLANLGVEAGASATLYHRAVVTDGSDDAYGPSRSVTIQRPVFGDAVFEAILSGNNEIPTVTSTAQGKITATFDGSTLTVDGSFEGLSEEFTGAHIHTGMAGETGGVTIPLEPAINDDKRSGIFIDSDTSYTLTSEQITALQNRGLYINVHSATYPGGEIRGQLVPQSDAQFRTNLSGAFEVPAVKTHGSGAVVLEMREDSLYVSGSFSGLSAEYSASHIHTAITGTNGGVAIGLTPSMGADNMSGVYLADENKFELTTEQQTALWNRELYVNVHTSANPGGELRGQVTAPVTAAFYASLSGSAENPSLDVGGSGALTIELSGDSLFASGSFSGLESDFTASHIHTGHSGTNGGVSQGLMVETEDNTSGIYSFADNRFELTSDQINNLFARNMYINVHSLENGGGELRGQVLGEATSYFRTKLNGIHENDPVIESEGFGSVDVEISGSRAIVSGGFSDLLEAYSASHVHTGHVDGNGGVAFGLNPMIDNETSGEFEVETNTFSLTEDQLNAIYDEAAYVNVHSSAHPGGEIRGQLLFGNNAFADMPELLSPEDEAEITISGDPSTVFTATWDTISDDDGNRLRNIWALSTDENFDEILFLANVGSETSAEITYGALDSLLTDLGLSVDASTTLYHAVMTTDGSNESFSETRTVVLTKGMITSTDDENVNKPYKFGLQQNYPNPFNPKTNIPFTLSQTGKATITIYNILGKKVAVIADQQFSAGEHTISFDASSLSSGVYIYRLQAEGKTQTKQLVLIK
ncbi:MAG: CHRD domain-containing protein [Gracilimonas sp.]